MSTFTAATWNVFNDTDPSKLPPVLEHLAAEGVSIILGQEFTNPQNRRVLRDAGWKLFFYAPQWVVAWHPEVWTPVDTRGVRLAETGWFSTKGHEFHSDAATAILCDNYGRTLTAASYHLPSHVQVADQPPNRIQALRESMGHLKAVADHAKTRAVLFGGDDNVDERVNSGAWGFMLEKATGLRLVQAPSATIGRRDRRIDDFRVRGLKPYAGSVTPGAGDHRIHIRKFGWA